MLGILTAPLHLGLVVWLWEWLLLPGHAWDRSIGGVVELGPVMSLLKHDGAVAELLDETVLSLNSSVGDLGDLVALEAIPALVTSRVDEVNNIQRIDKVDKGVSNIAIIRKINAQVHEVVLSPAGLVDDAFQHSLVYLIWDISEHDGGTNVGAFPNLVDVDMVVMRTWWAEMCSVDTCSILPTVTGALEFTRAPERLVWSGAWERHSRGHRSSHGWGE